jgi:hypothetical protein
VIRPAPERRDDAYHRVLGPGASRGTRRKLIQPSSLVALPGRRRKASPVVAGQVRHLDRGRVVANRPRLRREGHAIRAMSEARRVAVPLRVGQGSKATGRLVRHRLPRPGLFPPSASTIATRSPCAETLPTARKAPKLPRWHHRIPGRRSPIASRRSGGRRRYPKIVTCPARGRASVRMTLPCLCPASIAGAVRHWNPEASSSSRARDSPSRFRCRPS